MSVVFPGSVDPSQDTAQTMREGFIVCVPGSNRSELQQKLQMLKQRLADTRRREQEMNKQQRELEQNKRLVEQQLQQMSQRLVDEYNRKREFYQISKCATNILFYAID